MTYVDNSRSVRVAVCAHGIRVFASGHILEIVPCGIKDPADGDGGEVVGHRTVNV